MVLNVAVFDVPEVLGHRIAPQKFGVVPHDLDGRVQWRTLAERFGGADLGDCQAARSSRCSTSARWNCSRHRTRSSMSVCRSANRSSKAASGGRRFGVGHGGIRRVTEQPAGSGVNGRERPEGLAQLSVGQQPAIDADGSGCKFFTQDEARLRHRPPQKSWGFSCVMETSFSSPANHTFTQRELKDIFHRCCLRIAVRHFGLSAPDQVRITGRLCLAELQAPRPRFS